MEVIGNAYAAFDTLPQEIKEQACRSFLSCGTGFTRNPETNVWVCATCHKPAPLYLLSKVEECYECEKLYVPEKLPDKWLLCPNCS